MLHPEDNKFSLFNQNPHEKELYMWPHKRFIKTSKAFYKPVLLIPVGSSLAHIKMREPKESNAAICN